MVDLRRLPSEAVTCVSDDEIFLQHVAQQVSDAMGGTLDLATIDRIGTEDIKAAVVDATLPVMVDGILPEDDLVLLISNPAFPNMVSDAMARLQDVHARLDPTVGQRLHAPCVTGRLYGRSYAAFPRLDTLSPYRVRSALERRLVGRHVATWLGDIAVSGRRLVTASDIAPLFQRPFEYLADEPGLSAPLRAMANGYLTGPAPDPETLFTTIEHGDFWVGNVLFERMKTPLRAAAQGWFRVIDWGGVREDGYPFMDLIRYVLSTRHPDSKASRRDIERYRERLNVPADHVVLYAMASLGRLGLARHEYPVERYLHLVMRVGGFLKTHGYIR